MTRIVYALLCMLAVMLPAIVRGQFVGITGTGAGINYENYGTITTALDELRPFESGNTTITVYQDIFVGGFGGGVDLDQARLYYKTNSTTVGTINDGSWTVVNGTISALGGNNDRATFDITGVSPGTEIMFYIRYTEAGADYYGFNGTMSPHSVQPSTQTQLYKIRFNAATTPNTQRIDGLTHEWNSTTQVANRSSSTSGRTLDISWDSDHIYFLISGGFTASSLDRVHIAFDIDPGTTNGATGSYNGAQFPDRYRPDILFRARGTGSNTWTNEKCPSSGSGWGSTVAATSTEMSSASGSNTTNLEIRVQRSAIGSFSALGVYVFFGTGSDFLYDTYPFGNPAGFSMTARPLPIQIGFASLGSGVNVSTDDYFDAQYSSSSFDIFGSTIYRNLRISASGNVGLDVGGSGTVTTDLIVNGTLTIDAGATFVMRDLADGTQAGPTVDLNLNGDLVQDGGLSLSTTSGSDLFIAGNWSGAGTFTDNGRQTTFDGNTNQTLVGGKTFSFLRTNKSSGELQLSGNATATSDLTLTAGNLNLLNNTLTLGSSSSMGTLTLGSNRVYGGNITRFVNGSTAAIPIPAFAGTDDRTVTITFAAANAAGTTVTVRNLDYRSTFIHPGLENSNFTSGALFAAGINDPLKVAPFLWDITSNATQAYSLTLQGSGMNTVSDPNLLRILQRSNASSGYALGGTHVSGTGSSGYYTVTASGLTGFSEFTLGNGGPELLPVTWLQVGARRTAAGAEVSWATASELNNAQFEVERSSTRTFDRYQTVGTRAGAGTTSSVQRYQWLDADAPMGEVYYRIRQVDLDGRSSRSAVVRLDETGEGWLVYPTMVGREPLRLVALGGSAEQATARLVSAEGRVLWQGAGLLPQLEQALNAQLGGAAAGLYLLQLEASGRRQHTRVVRP